MRIRTLAVALGAALALGAAVVPAARGASDVLTITSVTTGPGILTISTTSDTPLTSLNVTLTSASNPDALSFTISDFTNSGTGTAGTWTLSSAITDAQLATGTYGIDVSAADSGGGSATDNSATFPWLMTPTISLAASRTSFSYDQQSITFSGTLSMVNPDGSAVDPSVVAHQQLRLTDSQNGNAAVTTGAGGVFSIAISRPDNNASYIAVLPATGTSSAGQSPPVTVHAAQDLAEVAARVSAIQLSYGQALTISGTAQYDSGTQFVPLANSTVQIYAGPASTQARPLAAVSTDSQGDYTYTFADKAARSYDVYAGGVPGDSFLDEVLSQAVAVTPKVGVALPLKITGLRASLSPFAVLTLKGCLIAGNGSFPPALTLRVESRPKASGTWHLLRSVSGLGKAVCGTAASPGLPFDYQVKVAAASAYYRLAYAGSASYQPAVSPVVHEAKTLTKITDFTISPRSVATKKFVTVSGRLWKLTTGWHPMAGQKIWILARFKGKWYFYSHKPLTSSAGRFSGKFEVFFSGPWLSEFMGNATYFAGASDRLNVTAKGAAAIPASQLAGLRPETSAGAVLADTGLRLAP